MNLNFAENLKHLRKEKGITQEKLSEVLGVSAQSVSRWELAICYPDIEMLPAIANYFGTTVDFLISNDPISKEKDYEIFCERLKEYRRSEGRGKECIEFVQEYCRKYPENDEYAFLLLRAMAEYACGDEKKTVAYMPVLLKNAERLLPTRWRYEVISYMAALCEEKDLDYWLSMTPYIPAFSRRNCLITRDAQRGEHENAQIQRSLLKIETIALQLEITCPDSVGPEKKAQYLREKLQIMDAFGMQGTVPDGWKMFYARKQLVLAACLFGLEKEQEGWEALDSAIEKMKYILATNEQWLPIGGAFFANLKVSKDWKCAVDENGKKHKLFAVSRFSNYSLKGITDLLTNPRWAWFDSVRQTPKYQAALQWVSEAEKKIRENA